MASWCKWIHDQVTGPLVIKSAPGALVSRTTKGTFIRPIQEASSSTSDNGKRLFNFYTPSGTSLGNLSAIDGRDLGVLITGYPAVQTKIRDSIRKGLTVRTTTSFRVLLAQASAAVSSTEFSICLFTGDLAYGIQIQLETPADLTTSEFLFSVSTELRRIGDPFTGSFETAHEVFSSQYTGGTGNPNVFTLSNVITFHASGVSNDVSTGFIVGKFTNIDNAEGELRLLALTVDALPSPA